MYNNPLNNVYKRLQRKKSSSKVIQTKKPKYSMHHMISELYKKLGKKRSTSTSKKPLEVELKKWLMADFISNQIQRDEHFVNVKSQTFFKFTRPLRMYVLYLKYCSVLLVAYCSQIPNTACQPCSTTKTSMLHD